MSTINTSISGSGYYQLSGSTSQSGGNGSIKSIAQTLLDSTSPVSAGNSSDAYLLDLSPAAQKYLNNSNSAPSTLFSGGTFSLTKQQQQDITDILAKYKDASYTQDTFNKIQDDLKAAGLDTQRLQLVDQAKSFNSTGLLISYLNGDFSASANTADSATENAKSTAYIQGIIKQWQGASTTYKSSNNSAAVSATSSSDGA